MRIVIIGGGATGLAAAYDLTKRGYQVSVYEKNNFLGGHASTFNINGTPIERGYHHWFTSDNSIIELCEEIGIGNQIKWVPSTVGTLFNDHIYDFVTPWDLLRYTPQSIPDRIKLGLSSLKIRRLKNWKSIESETAVNWLKNNVGNQIYEAFWGPMLRGKFGEDNYEKVGMAWVWGKMNTRFASRKHPLSKELLGYPIGSFKNLFDVLAKKITAMNGEIHLSTGVDRIITDSGRVTGINIEIEGEIKHEKFDIVIASTPSHIFDNITDGLSKEYSQSLRGVTYMAAVLLILVLDRPLSNKYWLNIADRNIPFVGVIEHTNLIHPSHYGESHIVYLSNYLTPDNKYYSMTPDEVLNAYMPHISKINPEFSKEWIQEIHHHKIDGAQPIIGPNYSDIMPSHDTGIKHLYLANTSQIYPEDRGTNYSVKMGRNVAKLAITNLCSV